MDNPQRNNLEADEMAQQQKLDRLSTAIKAPWRPDSLVGSFFHSTHTPGWQGCIVAEVAPGVYLVETFGWLAGESTSQHLVKLGDMSGWVFYDDAKWMNNAYGDGVAERWKRERRIAKGENPDGSPEEIAANLGRLTMGVIDMDQELLEDHLRDTRETRDDLREDDPQRVRVERYLAYLGAYRPEGVAE